MMTASKQVTIDGAKLKRLRESRPSPRTESGRMTQDDLADAAHISRSYIAEIERNRRRPRFLVAQAIAEALRVDLDMLKK